MHAQYSAALMVLGAALVGVLAYHVLRRLPWLIVIGLVWGGLWIAIMPSGIEAAKLAVGQDTMRERARCAASLSSDLGYWNGQRNVVLADCS